MTRYEKLVQDLTIEKMAETLYNGESEYCITMCKLKSGDKYTCPINATTKEECIKCAIEYLMMEASKE